MAVDNFWTFPYTHPLMTGSSLHQQAILAALSAKWDDALKLNKQIIETEPESIDALNRLARAYFEIGNLSESKKNYQKSLNIDPYNQIAFKFLKRIEACGKNGKSFQPSQNHAQIGTDLFIEEPGKTKIVPLLKVAEPQRLSILIPGEIVKMAPKNRGMVVTDQSDKYLGILPDDLARRLLKLMHGGNKYQVLIKTIKPNGVSVLIREMVRSARFKNQPSFIEASETSPTYSSDHIVVPQDLDSDSSEVSDEGETQD